MPEAEIPNNAASAFDVPRHVAIIMDGNGRWAAARGLPRAEGHRRGVEALRRTIRGAGEIGIKIVTIFSFSAENWSRPASEIGELMGLLRRFVRNDLAELHKSNVRVRVIGERADLEPDISRLLVEAEELTKSNDGLTLVVAFNYGARQEIVRAARRVADAVKRGELNLADVDMDSFSKFLDAPDIPDPDLIIRTSGEQRLSNFLLWQAAYSELVFVPTYWPDFDRADSRIRDPRISTTRAAVWRPRSADWIVNPVVDSNPVSQSNDTSKPLSANNLALRIALRRCSCTARTGDGLFRRMAIRPVLGRGCACSVMGMDGACCRQGASTFVFLMCRRGRSSWLSGLARSSNLGFADVGLGRAGGGDFFTIRAKTLGDVRHRLCGGVAAGADPFATRRRIWFCGDRLAVRDRVDDRCLRLFRGPRFGRAEVAAARKPKKNLVRCNRRYGRRHDRWATRRQSVRIVQHGCDSRGHIRTFSLGAIWRFVRILGEKAIRRERFRVVSFPVMAGSWTGWTGFGLRPSPAA